MAIRPVTIKDLAKELNISTATVSRALRGVPEVSRPTREAVLHLAGELDYQPNQIARSLVCRKTKNIGIVFPEVSNLFFASINQGIQDLAHKIGYKLVVSYSGESARREAEIIKDMISSRVEGLLVCLTQESDQLAYLEEVNQRGFPLVFFDRTPQSTQLSSVRIDDYEGAYRAVKHLLETGRRKIAHIGGPQQLKSFNHRAEAYRAALSEYGLPFIPEHLICGGFFSQDGVQAARKLMALPAPPDAIFAVSDTVALGAASYLKSIHKNIPEDIAMIGFANESFSPFVSPPLSTVEQHPYELGQTALRLLVKQLLTDKSSYAPEQIVIPPKLIIRESSIGLLA